MRYLLLLLTLLLSTSAYSDSRRINNVSYSHTTVGTSAADAIAAVNVDKDLKGWQLCHDAESTATYLAVSSTVDPALDGIRLGAGQCFECLECGYITLVNANVKAQAAATGYSVIQLK